MCLGALHGEPGLKVSRPLKSKASLKAVGAADSVSDDWPQGRETCFGRCDPRIRQRHLPRPGYWWSEQGLGGSFSRVQSGWGTVAAGGRAECHLKREGGRLLPYGGRLCPDAGGALAAVRA